MMTDIEREQHKREYMRNYRATHRAELAAQESAYRKDHREECKAQRHSHYLTHTKENAIYAMGYRIRAYANNRIYYAKHRVELKERYRNWREENPLRVKERQTRYDAKRRLLGCVSLNIPFVGCEGHHVDNDRVINVPKALHRSIYHRQDTGQGMAQMNAIAYNFLFKQEVEAALEDKREQLV